MVKEILLDRYGMILTHNALRNNIESYLLSFQMDEVFYHTLSVVKQVETLHKRFDFDLEKCIAGAYLHDIGRIIDKRDLVEFCRAFGYEPLRGEREAPGLLHQVASKILANEIFGIEDKEILDALAYHTTLKQDPTMTDMVVFLADKLSWQADGYQPLIIDMHTALEQSLEQSVYCYLDALHRNQASLTYYHKYSQEAYGYFKGILSIED